MDTLKKRTIYHLFIKQKISDSVMKKIPANLRVVIEDTLKGVMPGEGQHFYFGSLKAITDNFSYKILGISIHALYDQDWKSNPVYENDNITIRKGSLITTQSGK
jgi:hypothetical protein